VLISANENKKQGAGAANWGKEGDEWDNVDNAAAPADKEAFDAVEKKDEAAGTDAEAKTDSYKPAEEIEVRRFPWRLFICVLRMCFIG
jgi:hypothetical protein